IRLISGASPFCETFFDEVRVPARNVVGGVGRGWTVAKAVLAHERHLISRARDAAADREEPLARLARRYLGDDPVVRDRIALLDIDLLCSRLLLRRSDVSPSVLKLVGTDVSQRRQELAIEIRGFAGLGWEGPGFEPDELAATRTWLRSRA